MSIDHPNWLFRAVRRAVAIVYRPAYVWEGLENLPQESVILVGNHAQMHWPLCMEIYPPRAHYTWCAAEMMSFKEVPAYAYKDFWSSKPRSVRWIFKIISYLIAPLCCLIFNNARVIPVYRDTRVLGTFRISSQRLDEGADVAIFPECYEEYNNIVHSFQKGFAETALFHYRKNKKNVRFVPMYICPALRKGLLGKPTELDFSKPAKEELERVRVYLMDEVTRLALSLPRHRVVPYPNVAKTDYPMSQ